MCVKLYDLRYFFSPVCSVLSSCSVRRPMISVELLVCANRAEKCRYVT